MYEIFEQLLRKYGVTSYKVSKEAHVTQTALSNWKSGKSIPTTKTLQKIADYFGVTIDYLMTGRENEHTDIDELHENEQLDVARDADEIILRLENGDSALMRFEPDSLSESDREYLRQSLISMFTLVRLRNKEKGNGDQKDSK